MFIKIYKKLKNGTPLLILNQDSIFKEKINQEFEYINQFPKHYQKKHNEIRQAFVTRFPYTIYYIIEEKLKTILVIGVLAQKQSFEKIKRRL